MKFQIGIFAFFLIAGCAKKDQAPTNQKAETQKANQKVKPAKKVELKTTLGSIVLELDHAKAPKSVENFSQYVADGFYNGTIFHRVISTFMIQGGGFDKTKKKKQTRPAIENEAKNGLKNIRGTIAMARTRAPHSATAQFFINVKDNPNLDQPSDNSRWGYAVFGKVVSGMDVVDKIKDTPVQSEGGAFANIPTTTVEIIEAKIIE